MTQLHVNNYAHVDRPKNFLVDNFVFKRSYPQVQVDNLIDLLIISEN
jgi:hypothetical protein